MTPPDRKKPRVKLSGKNGDAFAILGVMREALRKAKYTDAEVRQFMEDAMSGDYDHLLQTCMTWADVS